MISERYAVAEKAALRRRRREGPLTRVSRSVTVRRERLSTLTAESTLVQLMLAMTCIVIVGLLYLAQASQVSVLQYNIAGLQYQQTALNVQNANLRATATQLQSLQRVDTAATTQLHMTKPDLSTAIWITPVTPPVVRIRPSNADTVAAQRASQPLAWLTNLYIAARSSL